MKKFAMVLMVVLAATLALPTTTEAAAKPKLTKTSVKIQKNKKVTVKIKNGKIKSVKSSNKKVASVSYKAYKKNKKNTGVSFTIKGEKKAGKATITVKTTKGKTLKCKVTNKVPKPKPTPAPAPEPTIEEDSEEEEEEPHYWHEGYCDAAISNYYRDYYENYYFEEKSVDYGNFDSLPEIVKLRINEWKSSRVTEMPEHPVWCGFDCGLPMEADDVESHRDYEEIQCSNYWSWYWEDYYNELRNQLNSKYYFPYVTDAEAKAKTLEYFKGNVTDQELKDCYFGCYCNGISDASYVIDGLTQIEEPYYDSVLGYTCYVYSTRDIAFKHASEMKPVIQEILALCNGKTPYQQCEAISKWYEANTHYFDDPSTETDQTAYGAFVNKSCVCQGYEEANDILLTLLGINHEFYHAPGHIYVVVHLAEGDYSLDNLWFAPGLGGVGGWEWVRVDEEGFQGYRHVSTPWYDYWPHVHAVLGYWESGYELEVEATGERCLVRFWFEQLPTS